jgi:phosphate transport system substrate-binding protein
MKKYCLLVLLLTIVLVMSCKDDKKEETILKGSASIAVDETILPMLQDQVDVFQNKYDAKITLVAKSEGEALNDLFNLKATIAILTRNLTEKEKINFSQKKIVPKITIFARDAIALIGNKSVIDTLVAMEDLVGFLRGEDKSKFKGIVFDNPNSSTSSYLKNLAKISDFPVNGVYSFNSNEEVIKFVSENKGMIGVIGMNWITQPTSKTRKYVDNVKFFSVKGLKSNVYKSPTQNNIAEGTYPLVRDLYIVNCQGFSGLGMGFASFIAGDVGQRIVLKSGLMPIRVPGRKFNVRNEIVNDKE